jgi:hypothetical protein
MIPPHHLARLASQRAVNRTQHSLHLSKELTVKANASDQGRVPDMPQRTVGGQPTSHKPKAAAKAGSAAWLIAALFLLSAIPLAAGAVRLTQLFEETLFRGILFRFLEEGFGSWIALALSALFFGFSHLNNPNATVWSAIAIALEAGVSIGAVYMATRSLWFAMGLHTAWNFLQGTIFGVAVWGIRAPADSLFQPLIQGNQWLTGGAFGIEASVIAVVLGLGLG